MTTATIATGWFILAASLLTLGPLTIWYVLREAKAEALAKEAESIIGASTSTAFLAYRLGVELSGMLLCGSRRPSNSLPFACTLHLGHPGDHRAFTAQGQSLAHWINVDEMPPLVTIPQQRGESA